MYISFHSSWAQKIPEILVNCTYVVNYDVLKNVRRASPQIDIYILNPIVPLTLQVVEAMIDEVLRC